MPKLPELLKVSAVVDKELLDFLSEIEEYSDEEQYQQIQLHYQAQVASAKDVSDKVNSWCWAINKIESQAEFYRAQSKRFATLARISENQAKSMKGFIKLTIEANGGKMPTVDFPKLRVQKTRASLQIDDTYTGVVPEFLIKQLPLSDILDKDKVKEMLNDGADIAFASMSEVGTALYGLK